MLRVPSWKNFILVPDDAHAIKQRAVGSQALESFVYRCLVVGELIEG